LKNKPLFFGGKNPPWVLKKKITGKTQRRRELRKKVKKMPGKGNQLGPIRMRPNQPGTFL